MSLKNSNGTIGNRTRELPELLIILLLLLLLLLIVIFHLRPGLLGGIDVKCRPQWPRGLWRGPVTTRLPGLRFRIPPDPWLSVSCDCCVLSGRSLCVGLITRLEEFYRVKCVWVLPWSLDNEEALDHKAARRKKKLVSCRPVQQRSLYALRQACSLLCGGGNFGRI